MAAKASANKPRSKDLPAHLWKPGQSGNPSGRPKLAVRWKDRCRDFMEVEGGWDHLKGIATAPEHESQLAALKVIVEYAYGKPVAREEVGDPGEFERLEMLDGMTPEDLRSLIRVAGDRKAG